MSQFIDFENQHIEVDDEGYLLNLNEWSPTLATYIATHETIILTPDHWEIIQAMRTFFETYEISPAMRPFTKYITQTLGASKGDSIYLLQLFPQSPAKLISKIAGLPKPANCL